MEFIDLGRQQQIIKSRLDEAVAKVLKHGKYILGPEVGELEEKLATFAGVKHCVTVANGTDALQIALMAIGLAPGDEVIMPAFNYIAAAEATMLLGGIPVYVDIDETFNIDPKKIEEAISSSTKAIIPVSMFGQCADFDLINVIGLKHGVHVIEDAAQSFGATYKGKKSCSVSDIACTSFFPSKPLGCYGDGGAIFTNDDRLAGEIRQISRHGQAERYHHVRLGVNSRLDTLQAAILLEKLEIYSQELVLRDKIATLYQSLIDSNKCILPVISEEKSSSWAQFTIRVEDRQRVKDRLYSKGVPTTVHYPRTLNNQPSVASRAAQVPISETFSRIVLSLPMHPYLSDEEVMYVASELNDAL